MTEQEMFNYLKNQPRSPLADAVNQIMKQINEHKVTRGEVKDMEAVGFELKSIHENDYYVKRPDKMTIAGCYVIYIYLYEIDAWQDAYRDYAVYYLIPASIEKGKDK